MPQVIMPQQQPSGLSSILPVAGAVGGAAYGGLPGAAAGAGLGSLAGGMVDPKQPTQQFPSSGNSEADAMARRSQQQDPLATLKQAEAALPSLPEHIRQQYAPAITQARVLAEQQQRQGVA